MERIPTGIDGLDNLIEGGVPSGHTILISGTPGTGKSIMALQFIVQGALKYGERGVFINLEREYDKLRDEALRFGWDLDKLQEEDKLRVFCPKLQTEFGDDPLSWLKSEEIMTSIKEFNPSRISVDSLTVVMQFSGDKGGYRRGVQKIIEEYSMKCTSFLIHEKMQGRLDDIQYTNEEFVADGVIYLNIIRTGNVYHRGVMILKMLGTKHPIDIRPFKIEDRVGVKIDPLKKINF
ncbi:MAG: ATPase domain-containing protein [Candidatus Altiarchaeota archaeon]